MPRDAFPKKSITFESPLSARRRARRLPPALVPPHKQGVSSCRATRLRDVKRESSKLFSGFFVTKGTVLIVHRPVLRCPESANMYLH
jgi:hypothetical protein